MVNWNKLKRGIKEREKQDIEANIKVLQGRLGKLYSFLLFWYPFRGSVEEHIRFLEKQLNG